MVENKIAIESLEIYGSGLFQEIYGLLQLISQVDSSLNTEWHFHPDIFKAIEGKFTPINFDIFASRLSFQVKRYASWKPDPGAEICNGMSFDWGTIHGYAFPPLNMIGKVLQKVENDECFIVLVVNEFRSQSCFQNATHA